MSLDERKQMWQDRIDAYRSSGATSVKAWCKQNHVGVQSMYNWMKRLDTESTHVAYPLTKWVAIDSSNSIEETSTITVKVGDVSIEIKEGFNHSLFNEVIQVLQSHVK
ncbi:hypothetical protein MHH70_08155 [Metasolibacillus sp. FSL H7-0170]|uniref:IS66 family insertion sequence element accessory protein TnpA n=1 Tax=Metasolibacillus sp. FSL H7-0170 TaxID=2921431 RepID=UPI0031581552